MPKIPKWAQDLTLNACLYLESIGYKVELPELKWRHTKHYCSSGTTYKTHVVVSAGTERTDAKMVLLHELAHWALPFSEHHSDKFWDLAWQLYRYFKLPVRYCLKREQTYRVGAVAAYRRNRKAKGW